MELETRTGSSKSTSILEQEQNWIQEKNLKQALDLSISSSASGTMAGNLNASSWEGESNLHGGSNQLLWADTGDWFSSWDAYDCLDDFLSYEIYP